MALQPALQPLTADSERRVLHEQRRPNNPLNSTSVVVKSLRMYVGLIHTTLCKVAKGSKKSLTSLVKSGNQFGQ